MDIKPSCLRKTEDRKHDLIFKNITFFIYFHEIKSRDPQNL